jgi:beta-barrel assembly-enhancing protease
MWQLRAHGPGPCHAHVELRDLGAMVQGPAAPEPSPNEGGEHPEARGFGSRRRWRWEIPLLISVLVGLPLLAIALARQLAQAAALRLPPELDVALGRPSWQALQLSGERCEDAAALRYVEAILRPLLEAIGPTAWRFELMLSGAPDVNAFALPGGYVVVNAGLLSAAQTGEEVAAVLAHEISHVTARHGTQRLAGGLGAAAALGFVLGFVELGAPAYTLAELASLGYGRGQEREADDLGLALLLRAGISPLGMATFFERLSLAPSPPELLSTHPDPGGRAEHARQAARGAQPRLSLPAPPGVVCGVAGAR